MWVDLLTNLPLVSTLKSGSQEGTASDGDLRNISQNWSTLNKSIFMKDSGHNPIGKHDCRVNLQITLIGSNWKLIILFDI